MSKLLAALMAIGFGVGVNVTMAQNVDSDKAKAQGQTDGAVKEGTAQAGKSAGDCDKLSGKEKDKCIQATPAGPVDTTTGQGSKAKSETAKDRDREKAQNSSDTAAPAQSNSSVGHPDKGQPGAATGQAAQTGNSNKTINEKNIPDQSKDTVGHPEERATTGEAKTLQEPGTNTKKGANDNSTSGAQQPK
jgi:hypothetical protein